MLSDQEFTDLKAKGQIVIQPVTGCFTYSRKSSYGLGIGFAELAEIDLEYAKQCRKLVYTSDAERVVLREYAPDRAAPRPTYVNVNSSPNEFFERVLSNTEVLKKLTTWLTAAKSTWLFHKATFRKPRVFCLTGYYVMSKVQARINRGGSQDATLSASSTLIGLASSVPIGGTIGPFSNGQTLQANISMSEPNIWAARFHELEVEYILMAADGKTSLPRMIKLRYDCTHPKGGLMGSGSKVHETQIAEEPGEIKRAQYTTTTLTEAQEINDTAMSDIEYWKAFQTATQRLEDDMDNEED